ncbi:MAG: N-acetyl-gamma-glutamyl-phosphate reductase [Pseudomonadota bacterium]
MTNNPKDLVQRTAILGASGYTGAELIRLMRGHPAFDIKAITADRQAGKPMAAVFPHLGIDDLPPLVTLDEVDFGTIDMVFCALPHGTTQEVIARLPDSVRIVDLSADFRLTNKAVYEEWYGKPHAAPELQGQAVYGLTEFHRPALAMARLVANPGCYPTASLLPLLPLLRDRLIEPADIVIDAKSGVSGAGRGAKLGSLFAEVAEGLQPYGVGHHRHMPEIEQELSAAAGEPVRTSFTPHLVPMNRGMLATCYVSFKPGIDRQQLRASLVEAYGNEPFVHVLDEAVIPSTRQVRGTNHCFINVFDDRREGGAIITSVIDNLVKGASGQAIQNANVMLGLDEITGLTDGALIP